MHSKVPVHSTRCIVPLWENTMQEELFAYDGNHIINTSWDGQDSYYCALASLGI